jgi:hypothetical protein
MLDCLIIGDELAIGVAMNKPHCAVAAKPYINSQTWVETSLDLVVSSKTTIISLMTHDDPSINSKENLIDIRSRVTSGKVFWIMPLEVPGPNFMKQIIVDLAKINNDAIIYISPTERKEVGDIHPTEEGYNNIAKRIK